MHRIIRSWPVVGLVAALTVVAMVSPASAQYAGNERGFIVSPLRVPAGGDLSGLGFGCTPTSTVTITIQGEAGIFTTLVAEDDSTYAFSSVPISPTLVIGDTYTAMASCDGVFETADFTVICASGDEPDINGDCPIPPTTTTTTTTTTTVPGASTTTTLVPTTTVAPTTTIGTGSVNDPLAITGASILKFFQFAATLVGVGALFMVLGRRRDREPAQAY
jgi:hypothetical protein